MPAPLDLILNPVDLYPSQATVAPPAHPPEEDEAASALSLVCHQRVSKACTQCRRDKTRCDGGHPCGACTRKGRDDLCVVGCVACRKSRLTCEESRPCGACRKHGRECVEDNPAAIAASHLRKGPLEKSTSTTTRTNASAPATHRYIPDGRARIACLACRRKSRKCGGGETCPSCLLYGEDCVYVPRAPNRVTVKQRCTSCREKNRKCEQARPCRHCVKDDVHCVDVPRKNMGQEIKVKRACAGCRANKIQCEVTRPCAGCKRKKVECVEQACTACLKLGTKCKPCRRSAYFGRDDLDPGQSHSDSKDEDNTFSIPSLPSPSPTPYAPLNRLSDAGPSGLQTQSKSPYPASNMPRKYPSLDTPQMYPIIPESPESPHMHLTFPSAPAAHPMRPRPQSGSFTCSPELPSSFNTGFPAPLSLSTSVSHMRTPMPMTPMVKPVIKHACLP